MCYQCFPQMMGHPMAMFPPWSQQPPSAPKKQKAKKMKPPVKPNLMDMFDEQLNDLEKMKRVHEAYGSYIKAIEDNAVRKDKEKKEKDKPKKREGFNYAEVSLMLVLASPFVVLFYKYVSKMLGI